MSEISAKFSVVFGQKRGQGNVGMGLSGFVDDDRPARHFAIALRMQRKALERVRVRIDAHLLAAIVKVYVVRMSKQIVYCTNNEIS